MNITVVSDANSWINSYVEVFITELHQNEHDAQYIHRVSDISQGDIVFYLSCSQIVAPEILQRNQHNIVIHESDLPKGKGWSPLTWQILEGKNDIPITMFEAVKAVDSGKVYLRDILHYEGYELIDDLRRQQALVSLSMCREFLRRYPSIVAEAEAQTGESTFYSRRKPIHSSLDVNKTIREQFNLLRVVDNERYPAFFEIDGHRYKITITHDEA
jgi:methionyl-tRNA formyltransferase